MGCAHLLIAQKEIEGWRNGQSKGLSSYTNKNEYERERIRQRRREDPETYRAKDAANRKKHKEKIKIAQANWRIKNRDYQNKRAKEDIAKCLWVNAHKRARAKGLAFGIDETDVVVPTVCPVFGVVLETHIGKKKDNSASIDRIDNDKGYVPGNIRVISMRANWLKGNATLLELKQLVAYMESNLP